MLFIPVRRWGFRSICPKLWLGHFCSTSWWRLVACGLITEYYAPCRLFHFLLGPNTVYRLVGCGVIYWARILKSIEPGRVSNSILVLAYNFQGPFRRVYCKHTIKVCFCWTKSSPLATGRSLKKLKVGEDEEKERRNSCPCPSGGRQKEGRKAKLLN